MRKYFVVFKNHLSVYSSYRFEVYASWLYRLFAFGLYYFLWSITAKNAEETARLLLYFALFQLVFENISSLRIAKWYGDEVNSGEIANYLVKPINIAYINFARVIARSLVRIVIPILLFISIAFIFPETFAPSSALNLFYFIIFTLIGFLVWNYFLLNIATISFRGTQIGFMLTVIDLSLHIVKGTFIPAYLFPEEFQKILSFTPIPYFASFPIDVYSGDAQLSKIIFALIVSLSWLLFFYILYLVNFKRSLKIYDSLGG